ncbi:MAG TPA: DUF4340 domain-containing protein, partial [Candidatus Binatia bacterium]|nr:DUF4340 domain-containing protein [Candidatus Binatia bacterium]
LFKCTDSDIAEVRFDRADGAGFVIKKSAADWVLVPPPGDGTVRQSVAQRIVVGLATLAGNEVAGESAETTDQLAVFGLDTPEVEVEVFRQDGSSCGRAAAAVVGADSPSPAYFVKRTDSGLVTTLPAYLYSRLDMRRDDLIAVRTDETTKAPAQ